MKKGNSEEFVELFRRYNDGEPILKPSDWPYPAVAVFNPGAVRFGNKILLLVRVEDGTGISHLTKATSKDGRTDWEIDSRPTLIADRRFDEAEGLEDPRVVWMKERKEFVLTCVSFYARTEKELAGVSIITTKDFSSFERLGQRLLPVNKNASLFPRTIGGRYVLISRPMIGGTADIWVCSSPDLIHWGNWQPLFTVKYRKWEEHRIGLGCPPIETPEGWLIIYHGARDTASGTLYRAGLALLDLEDLKLIKRSREWVLGPSLKVYYEMHGFVPGVIFPCGAVVDDGTQGIQLYYGASDSVVSLAEGNLNEILEYLKHCSSS